ncbi:membrane associated rhomboid family serine protease [Dysgonomonas sp. PFB1-18]|uniref:rhomboid family intramembrane serine protease n=1 Tax=unclassified Dysgonomonas TaxID=2630389 RepID=UPI002475D7F7|nr:MULTISPECIES: rhomboid family intramembrane serine protease [unclassified Dysgonomonas]MDH6310755.1 membrane associated rhomboid family serine protease [Dysgonomonas sp. PF1-14]MDH6340605.1 membrane associated rhomboid family serine protease [Dysgonomonas sp. PF1-16]MDH6382288.1 membrane associated rhomboid family serine protease [Dysgonomonas sp. PFB1-18]MDH6399575.1 membrane associated rhomboid family serine protease [Dysgonomonas sp. PF1-23]
MFDIAEIIPIIIIALTAITSVKGFNDMAFFDRYKFNVGAILGTSKQWDRMLTSATLHGDYMHLIFNMFTLYIFSDVIIHEFGVWKYLAIYFLSIIGGGLLSLWMHRKEYYYSAIGASGGVVGVLFAAIAIYPNMTLGIMFIIPMPAWIFGIAYLAFSVYAMQKQQGNIGHDAHLGGAAIGLIMAILFEPALLKVHPEYIGLMILPLIVLAYFAWKKK